MKLKDILFEALKAGDITETPEFKQWFGNSKVVDENGMPLIVYHGTTADFSKFNPRRQPRNWFTSDHNYANLYAGVDAGDQGIGGNVMPLYVSLKNPRIFEASNDGLADWATAPSDAVFARKGHDGVLFINNSGKIKTGYTLQSRQIKSAIGNKGTFNSASDDVTEGVDE